MSRFVALGAALATAPLVARALGPEGRGVATAAVAFCTILPVVVGLGVPMAVRHLAASDAEPRWTAYRIYSACTIPVCLCAGGFFWFALAPQLSTPEATALLLMTTASSFYLDALCSQSVLIAEGRYGAVAVLQGSQAIVAAGLYVVLALLSALDLTTVLAAQAAGSLATFAYGRLKVRAAAFPGRERTRDLVRAGRPYAPSQTLEIASTKVDQVLMLPLLGARQSGFYAVAMTIATVPTVIGHAVGTATFRQVASAPTETRTLTAARCIRSGILLGLACSALLAAAAPTLVPLLFGQEFQGAVVPTILALVATPLLIGTFVTGQALAASRLPRAMLICTAAAITVGVALLALLGPHFGAEGAAVALASGQFTCLVLGIRSLRIPIRQMIPRLSDARAICSLLLRG